MRKVVDCNDCGQEFAVSPQALSALYWHLRNEHGYDREDAYEFAGQSMGGAHWVP